MANDNKESNDLFAEMRVAMKGGFAFQNPTLDDTTCVIMATSLVDEILKFALLLQFRAKATKQQIETVFTGNGPLASFANKIAVAEALGVVLGDLAHDLKILRKIRNEFAHSLRLRTIDEFKQCESLKLKRDIGYSGSSLARTSFVISSSVCISDICAMTVGHLAEQHTLANHKAETVATANKMLSIIYGNKPIP